MSRRKRTLIVLGALVCVVGLELGLKSLKAPDAIVRIVNVGDAPITDMQLVLGENTVDVAPIAPQGSSDVRISGRKKQTLKITFRQLDNPLTGFQVPDFDAAALQRDSLILVLEIRSNEFVRSHAPDETPTMLGRMARNVSRWFGDEPTEDQP